MRFSAQPTTWRLLERSAPSHRKCPQCGQSHRYLMRKNAGGACQPVLFPPGVDAPTTYSGEVELHVAGPVGQVEAAVNSLAYYLAAERVRETTIRCEGCGERFDDLERYRLHDRAVRYR